MRRRAEVPARYVEPWPAELACRHVKARHHASHLFGPVAKSKKQPTYDGDGREEPAVYSWGEPNMGRLGTMSESCVLTPKMVSRTSHLRFVGCASGKKHSLLVSESGIVYAFGDGAKGQLGSKRVPTVAELRRERRHDDDDDEGDDPLAVTTGIFLEEEQEEETAQIVLTTAVVAKEDHVGKSLESWLSETGARSLRVPTQCFPSAEAVRAAEVAAGAWTSFARETAPSEATRSCAGLKSMLLQSHDALSKAAGVGAEALGRLYAALREESFELQAQNRGRVLAWGSGLATPRFIKGLQGVRSIAAGAAHVLALAEDGRVLTWGSGRDGRLGHGDYRDLQEPKELMSEVRLVAAGDAHSLAVGDDGVYTWGRAAHGRLGLRRHLNQSRPQKVQEWPASFKGRVVAAALGGAHSVVLVEEAGLPPGLVHPWGVKRRVYAWGYGEHGALGTDKLRHECVPVLAKTPKWETFVTLSCGKSHTFAITARGDLYGWGKNDRGELGVGDRRCRVRPAPVTLEKRGNRTGQFLSVCGGDSHTVALSLRHSAYSLKTIESKPLDTPNVQTTTRSSDVLNRFQCARQGPSSKSRSSLYCLTCDLGQLCGWCEKLCHAGHDLTRDPARIQRRQDEVRRGLFAEDGPGAFRFALCECGFDDSRCKRMAMITESSVDPTKVQTLCRRFLASQERKNRVKARDSSRQEAANRVWSGLVGAVWRRERDWRFATAEFVERWRMAIHEQESKASRRFLKLQVALQSLQNLRHALRSIAKQTGAPDLLEPTEEPRFLSTRALRQWHRRHKRCDRRSLAELALHAAKYGLCSATAKTEEAGRAGECDLDQFTCERSRSIAAPERLYSRVRSLRGRQQRRLSMRRTFSLEPRLPHEDKSFNGQRSAEESAWDKFEGLMLTKSRLGAVKSLSLFEEHDDKSIEMGPLARALLMSRIMPGKLFHRARELRPPIDVDHLAAKDATKRAANEKRARAFAKKKQLATRKHERPKKKHHHHARKKEESDDNNTQDDETTQDNTTQDATTQDDTTQDDNTTQDNTTQGEEEETLPKKKKKRAKKKKEDSEEVRRRSASLGAPERVVLAADSWERRAKVMRRQREAPTKAQIVLERRHYLHATYEDRDLCDTSLLLDSQEWADQKRLIEILAVRNGKREWVKTSHTEASSSEESSESDGDVNEDPETARRRRLIRRAIRRAARKRVKEHEGDAPSPAPAPSAAVEEAPAPLLPQPSRWEACYDDEENRYFYCEETGESQWETPEGFREDDH